MLGDGANATGSARRCDALGMLKKGDVREEKGEVDVGLRALWAPACLAPVGWPAHRKSRRVDLR